MATGQTQSRYSKAIAISRTDAAPRNGVEADLTRIEGIILNARATWFTLIGVQVFACVTLAGVEDVAFFMSDVKTELPLAGISVPITSFFWAGSLLIAGIYVYFHLYLEQLWEALGQLPPHINGKPAAASVHPWIVADAAFYVRDKLQGLKGSDSSSRVSSNGFISSVISFFLVWLFGLLIMCWFWMRSMPAHDFLLSTWVGLLFTLTIYTCFQSLYWLFRAFKPSQAANTFSTLGIVVRFGILCVILFVTAIKSNIDLWEGEPRLAYSLLPICTNKQKAENRIICFDNIEITNDLFRPSRAQLHEIVSSKKPDGWLGKDVLRSEFKAKWCRENRPGNCNVNPFSPENKAEPPVHQAAFEKAWSLRWHAHVKSFKKPDFRGKDLRGVEMSSASLEGADLRSSRLDNANLEYSNLQYSNLFHSNLTRAKLFRTNLDYTRLVSTDFSFANLSRASMQNSVVLATNFTGSNLSFANLHQSKIDNAKFIGTNLRFARLTGAPGNIIVSTDASWDDAQLHYAMLRYLDISTGTIGKAAGFERTFGDASVRLPDGIDPPLHWCNIYLTDQEYFGRYRGWLKSKLDLIEQRDKAVLSLAAGKAALLSAMNQFPAFPIISPDEPCPRFQPNDNKTAALATEN